mmetsp:Transcript_1322/g.2729  ORF Transcript_1322/g.2729 Transcript_1322/m.2729 type:complete len:845 (+) Transcript_1322:18-2552(+)
MSEVVVDSNTDATANIGGADNDANSKDGNFVERVVAKSDPTGEANAVDMLKSTEQNLDWVLTNYDQKNSEPQSLEEELKRLQALRSYLLLDSEREEQFERLTALASRVMDVPITLVSLVDLGRQWFMSNRGLGDVRETPRSAAFCSHAIQSKTEVLIIKDAKEDPRFVKNPLVTGPPFIRFYAGAPLETPEGYKLGTFCIIDTKPWPQGLDLDGKQNLREFAGLAVEVMISRKKRREREEEKNSQMIACAAHDLLTPLSGIELSLHLLKEDDDFQSKMAPKHKGKMNKVETCSGIIQEICDSVRNTYAETKSSFEQSLMTARQERVKISTVVNKLHTAIDQLKTDVLVDITVDPNVPKEIISDPSKLFRGALNFLVVACKRTKKGQIVLTLFMKEKSAGSNKSVLIVKCEDTAPDVDVNVYEHLFKPPSEDVTIFEESKYTEGGKTEQNLDLCLFSVACEMNVIGGEYGFRPRTAEDDKASAYDKEVGSITGSVFWFCVPCMELEDDPDAESDKEGEDDEKQSVLLEDDGNDKSLNDLSDGQEDSKFTRKKRALVIEDSAIIRTMLCKILAKLGFEVSEAENGMTGMEKLKSTLYDITLVDFLMPIMDGLDCMQQYREWERYHRPWMMQRMIGISAHATQEDVEKGLKIGMDDYRAKPITAKVLSDLIECDKQVEMSRRLDELERREALIKDDDEAKNDDEPKKERKKHEIDGRACTLLMISPRSEQENTKQMQEVIKSCGWQTTTASTEREAIVWLKMRTWNLVLVDETLGPVIGDFREWESKKRQNRQERITLMTEKVDEMKGDGKELPGGLDALVGKPMGLAAVDKLLEETYLHLSETNGK